jgi:hypothetical protein
MRYVMPKDYISLKIGTYMNRLRLIRTLTIIVLVIILAQTGYSQDKVGTSAAPFLGIAIGPAGIAMGGAYSSFGRDASAMFWNPGAMSQMNQSYVSFSHTEWFLGTDYNWIGIVLDVGGGSAFGMQLAILDYGEEDVTTVEFQEGTGNRWTAQDLFATISYARNFTERFSVGGSLKFVQERIFNESGSAFAIDLGLLFITPFNGMRLGVSMTNFGTDMTLDGKDLFHQYDQDPENFGNNPTITSKLKTDAWPLPLFFRLGLSMDVVKLDENTMITLAADAVLPSDNMAVVNVGGEFNYQDLFFLRAGYKSIGRVDSEEGLTAGLGVAFNVPSMARIIIDYAYAEFGLLGDIHTFGVGFAF